MATIPPAICHLAFARLRSKQANSRRSSFNRANASWGDVTTHQIQIHGHGLSRLSPNMGFHIFARSTYRVASLSALRALNGHDVPRFLSVEANDIRYPDILNALGYSLFKCIGQFTFCCDSSRGT